MAKEKKNKRGIFARFVNSFNRGNELQDAADEYNELRETIETRSAELSDKAMVLFQLRNDAYSILSKDLTKYAETIQSCPNVVVNGLNFAVSNYDAVIAEYTENPENFNKINPDNISGSPNRVAFLGTSVVGGGVAIGGSSALLAIATTFGTAGTGTAISTLGGVAATNAALAWLGGGTLAAGGAGVAGGTTILSLMGPIGWGIAGIGALAFIGLNAKDRAKNQEAIEKLEDGIEQLTLVKNQLNAAHRAIDDIIEDTKSYFDIVKNFLSSYKNFTSDYSSPSFKKDDLFHIVECAKTLSKLSKQSVNLSSVS